jgi:hypothetical protein
VKPAYTDLHPCLYLSRSNDERSRAVAVEAKVDRVIPVILEKQDARYTKSRVRLVRRRDLTEHNVTVSSGHYGKVVRNTRRVNITQKAPPVK